MLSAKYLSVLDNGKCDLLPRFYIWLAVPLLFLIANYPVLRLADDLMFVNPKLLLHIYKAVFFCGVLTVCCPLAADIFHYVRTNRRELAHSTVIAAIITYILCGLVTVFLPATPVAKPLFCEGLGCGYKMMSLHPFTTVWGEFYFRRILLPALGYISGLSGERYPILCFGVTFLLIVLVVQFLRSRTDCQLMPAGRWHQGCIVVLSLATSGFVLLGLQWPCYTDQLAFIFMLLLFLVPMRAQSRLACVILTLLSHDGTVFPLTPIILICFPRREIMPALVTLPLFIFAFALGYHFKLINAFLLHEVIGNASHLDDALRYPLVELLGVFSAFKLFWLVFAAVLYACARARRFRLLIGLCALMFSFVPVLFIAWDVTRITNFSFMALLLVFPIIYKEQEPVFLKIRTYLPMLAAVSFLIPTYNIYLYGLYSHGTPDENGRVAAFREPGIYQSIAAKLPITLPAADKAIP